MPFTPGNVTPISEANFYGDPAAANIVLQSSPNMYIYPLNVTQYSIITPEMAEYIEAKGKAHSSNLYSIIITIVIIKMLYHI